MNLGIVSLIICSVGIAVMLFVLTGVMLDLLPAEQEKAADPKGQASARSTRQWVASLGNVVGVARTHTTAHIRLHR